MEDLKNLESYLSQAEPLVNKDLRAGNKSLLTFDGLFEEGEIPQKLYRLMPNESVVIHNQMMCDLGYLSCTTSIDNFISHTSGEHIACLKILLDSPQKRIKVNDLLPNANDEGEYILPANTRLKLINQYTYSDNEQFKKLIEQEELHIGSKELTNIYRIKSVTLYLLKKA